MGGGRVRAREYVERFPYLFASAEITARRTDCHYQVSRNTKKRCCLDATTAKETDDVYCRTCCRARQSSP